MTTKPFDFASTVAVIGPDGSAVPVESGPTLYEDLDRDFDKFKGRRLVATYAFDSDWPTWEMHPAGDEIVCLLSGEVRMVFDRNGSEDIVHLTTPGSYVIVPKGMWHTARVVSAANMLFITPGEDTQNRPV